MNPPSAVLGGGVHGKVCWLIAYYAVAKYDHMCSVNYRGTNLFSCAITRKQSKLKTINVPNQWHHMTSLTSMTSTD